MASAETMMIIIKTPIVKLITKPDVANAANPNNNMKDVWVIAVPEISNALDKRVSSFFAS